MQKTKGNFPSYRVLCFTLLHVFPLSKLIRKSVLLTLKIGGWRYVRIVLRQHYMMYKPNKQGTFKTSFSTHRHPATPNRNFSSHIFHFLYYHFHFFLQEKRPFLMEFFGKNKRLRNELKLHI